MNLKNVLKKVYNTAVPETWCCAVRFNENADSCLLNNTDDEFIVLPNTKKYWCADPFLFEKDGNLYVFFEALDYVKRKGLLGCRTVSENGFGDIKIIYEGDEHLSFPYIYEENGEIYIMPESSCCKELFRLKCVDFPDKWVKEKVLIKEKLVDTILFDYNGRRYYLTQNPGNNNIYDRLDMYYENEKGIAPSENNPVKRDINTARCAGKIFEYDGRPVRPSQDCGASYGDKLNFNEVCFISEDSYKENLILTVSAADIKTDSGCEFFGVHTYNKLNNAEVIDLKIKPKFSLRNTYGAVLKVFRGLFK